MWGSDGLPRSALAGAVSSGGRKSVGAATYAGAAAAGTGAGTGPHLGQHGALIGKNSIDNIYSLSGDLKAPSGQAIITTENREKTH